jgi:hypothetical protein
MRIRTGQTLFRSPVPALTQLWISPDARFVLGLSNVKLWNPYQVVLFDRPGRLLLKRRISSDEAELVPAEFETLLRRYPKARAEILRLSHHEQPRLIESGGRPTAVELRDPKGQPFQIPIP